MIWVTTFLMLSLSSYAEDGCPELNSAQNVLSCVLQEHPEIRHAHLGVLAAEAGQGAAALIPNPELDSNAGLGKSLGDQLINSQVSLMQRLELGGKRGARVERAQAMTSLSIADKTWVMERVALETVTQLYRLRHIQVESEILGKISQQLRKAEKFLKMKPLLTPEQQISMTLFYYAQTQTDIENRTLFAETESIRRLLSYSLGRPMKSEEITKILPVEKKTWPEIEGQTDLRNLKGSAMQRASAFLQDSKSMLSIEEGKAWPDLEIGPFLQFQRSGAVEQNTYGLGMRFALPLFHMNGPGKEAATRFVEQANLGMDFTSQQVLMTRDVWVNKYNIALQSLKDPEMKSVIAKRYEKINQLFDRGLISGALVLESFRQILEVNRRINSQELAAIDALWRIFAIDGKILQEKI
jgi:cobalt-zinc-cadmium efflux system outer membrane protein